MRMGGGLPPLLLEVFHGVLAEDLYVYGVPNGVQKDFCGFRPGCIGCVGGNERGEGNLADRMFALQRVIGRWAKLSFPFSPDC